MRTSSAPLRMASLSSIIANCSLVSLGEYLILHSNARGTNPYRNLKAEIHDDGSMPVPVAHAVPADFQELGKQCQRIPYITSVRSQSRPCYWLTLTGFFRIVPAYALNDDLDIHY